MTRLARALVQPGPSSAGGNRQIRALPPSIGDCHRLAELSAAGCQLAGVPASLARCHSLVSLDLSGNQLGVSADLPEALATGLVNLRELSVARNKLVSLPNALGDMRQLTRLDCRENLLRAVPHSVGGRGSDRPLLALSGHSLSLCLYSFLLGTLSLSLYLFLSLCLLVSRNSTTALLKRRRLTTPRTL